MHKPGLYKHTDLVSILQLSNLVGEGDILIVSDLGESILDSLDALLPLGIHGCLSLTDSLLLHILGHLLPLALCLHLLNYFMLLLVGAFKEVFEYLLLKSLKLSQLLRVIILLLVLVLLIIIRWFNIRVVVKIP